MEDKNPYELDAGPVAAPRPADVRCVWSVQANTSLSLEEMPVDTVDFAIRETVIVDILTSDRIVARYLGHTHGANQ